MKEINLVGLTGSLRKESFNKKVLENIKSILPDGVSLEILDLSNIPFFNEDIEKDAPEAVKNLCEKLKYADGLVISTPEYNASISPVLKNALDWASRGEDKPLNGKPLAIMSASPSLLGGIRAQYHLRQICVILNLIPLNVPEVVIMRANEKFDEKGKLNDEHTRKVIRDLMDALIDKINK